MTSTSTTPVIPAVFRDLPPLRTARLLLRKIRLEDAADMFEYAKDPEVSRYTLWTPHRSLDETRAYLSCVLNNYREGRLENWGLECRENGKFIGTCGYFSWDPANARAEIHYALSRAYSGRGLMTEAVREVLRFGFEAMQCNRIEAKCMPPNTGSERVMRKAGMTFEGIMREGILARGKFEDLKVYSILKREWR
ncbi:MAG: GNAT family N-acetyltransferase [Endomicrobiales bacterium]